MVKSLYFISWHYCCWSAYFPEAMFPCSHHCGIYWRVVIHIFVSFCFSILYSIGLNIFIIVIINLLSNHAHSIHGQCTLSARSMHASYTLREHAQRVHRACTLCARSVHGACTLGKAAISSLWPKKKFQCFLVPRKTIKPGNEVGKKSSHSSYHAPKSAKLDVVQTF